MRREPRLNSGAPHPRTAPASAPLHDEDDEPWDNMENVPQSLRQKATEQPVAAGRTGALGAETGKRMAREAQPSLLDEGLYQLPALTLLAEPKKQVGPIVSADALEQNASAARGHAGGFRRQGRDHQCQPGPGGHAL